METFVLIDSSIEGKKLSFRVSEISRVTNAGSSFGKISEVHLTDKSSYYSSNTPEQIHNMIDTAQLRTLEVIAESKKQ